MLTGQEWFKGVDSSGPISQTGTAGIGAIQTRRPARTPASSAVPKVRIRFPPAASPLRTRRPSPFATGRSSRPACPPKPPRLLIGIYIFRKRARGRGRARRQQFGTCRRTPRVRCVVGRGDFHSGCSHRPRFPARRCKRCRPVRRDPQTARPACKGREERAHSSPAAQNCRVHAVATGCRRRAGGHYRQYRRSHNHWPETRRPPRSASVRPPRSGMKRSLLTIAQSPKRLRSNSGDKEG
jgi:hypothetical protein